LHISIDASKGEIVVFERRPATTRAQKSKRR
jgi:hypothetical protein